VSGRQAPTYAIYPELLEQNKNYQDLYQENFLEKKFLKEHQRPPTEAELAAIRDEAQKQMDLNRKAAENAPSDRAFYDAVMKTPRMPDQVHTANEMADRIMSITSPQYKERITKAITEKASEPVQKSFVELYNAFNSPKFDSFMSDIADRSLQLCRKAGECSALQRLGIPDKYMAQVLKQDADELGVKLETLSRYVGREPGRLYYQRIQRGSLIIDDGAPGNHGMMPHALQNLFIYKQIGKDRTQNLFKEMTGWTYERMFDANAAFTPIPSTRDITRRQYWTGVFTAGNRAEVSKLGELVGETGRYSGFLRENKLELVGVEEIENKQLVNQGSVVNARYGDKEFSFKVDRDGVPEAGAADIVKSVKLESNSAHFNEILAQHAGDSASLDKSMAEAASDLPAVKIKSGETQEDALLSLASSRYPGQKVEFQAPQTAPLSGSKVYMVNVDGKTTDVMKVYETKPQNMGREIAGLQTLNDLKPEKFSVPEVSDAFRLEENGRSTPVLMMKAAPGEDGNTAFARVLAYSDPKDLEQARNYASQVGESLGELHGKSLRAGTGPSEIRNYKEYEVSKAKDFLNDVAGSKRLEEKGWITSAEREALEKKGSEQINSFARDGPSRLSLVHGDFHVGNFVLNDGKVTIIDTETLADSVRAGPDRKIIGSSDPLSDVGRLVESIGYKNSAVGGTNATMKEVERTLLESYSKTSGIPLAEVKKGMEFHQLRYDLLQVSKDSKISEEAQRAELDRTLQRLGIRDESKARAPASEPGLAMQEHVHRFLPDDGPHRIMEKGYAEDIVARLVREQKKGERTIIVADGFATERLLTERLNKIPFSAFKNLPHSLLSEADLARAAAKLNASPHAVSETLATIRNLQGNQAAAIMEAQLRALADGHFANAKQLEEEWSRGKIYYVKGGDDRYEHVEEIRRIREKEKIENVVGTGGCNSLDIAKASASSSAGLAVVPTIVSTACISVNKGVLQKADPVTGKLVKQAFKTEVPSAVYVPMQTIKDTRPDLLKRYSGSGIADVIGRTSGYSDYLLKHGMNYGPGMATALDKELTRVNEVFAWSKSFKGWDEPSLEFLTKESHEASLSVIRDGSERSVGWEHSRFYNQVVQKWSHEEVRATHGEIIGLGSLISTAKLGQELEKAGVPSQKAYRYFNETQSTLKRLGVPTTEAEFAKLGLPRERIIETLDSGVSGMEENAVKSPLGQVALEKDWNTLDRAISHSGTDQAHDASLASSPAYKDLPLGTRAEETARDLVQAVQSPERTVTNILESWDAASKLDVAATKLRAFPEGEALAKESRAFVEGANEDLSANRFLLRSSSDPKATALASERTEESFANRAAKFEERKEAFAETNYGQPEATRILAQNDEGVARSLKAGKERDAIYSGAEPVREISNPVQMARVQEKIRAGKAVDTADAQAIVREGMSRREFYDNPSLYKALSENPDTTKAAIASWNYYYEDAVDKVETLLGKKYVPLLADPGIASRHSDFIAFARSYLAKNGNVDPAALRAAYSEKLGNVTLYRGILLTDKEAAAARKTGLVAPGLRDPQQAENALKKAFDPKQSRSQRAYGGSPPEEIFARTDGEKQKVHPRDNHLYMSATDYPEVAETLGYHPNMLDYGDRPEFQGKKKLYVAKLDVPALSTVRPTSDSIFSAHSPMAFRGQDQMLTVGEKKFIYSKDNGVEVFVPYRVAPQDLKLDKVSGIPPEFKMSVPTDEEVAAYATKLREGSVQDKIKYVEGRFYNDWGKHGNYESVLKNWIKDPETPVALKEKSILGVLSVPRKNEFDMTGRLSVGDLLNMAPEGQRKELTERLVTSTSLGPRAWQYEKTFLPYAEGDSALQKLLGIEPKVASGVGTERRMLASAVDARVGPIAKEIAGNDAKFAAIQRNFYPSALQDYAKSEGLKPTEFSELGKGMPHKFNVVGTYTPNGGNSPLVFRGTSETFGPNHGYLRVEFPGPSNRIFRPEDGKLEYLHASEVDESKPNPHFDYNARQSAIKREGRINSTVEEKSVAPAKDEAPVPAWKTTNWAEVSDKDLLAQMKAAAKNKDVDQVGALSVQMMGRDLKAIEAKKELGSIAETNKNSLLSKHSSPLEAYNAGLKEQQDVGSNMRFAGLQYLHAAEAGKDAERAAKAATYYENRMRMRSITKDLADLEARFPEDLADVAGRSKPSDILEDMLKRANGPEDEFPIRASVAEPQRYAGSFDFANAKNRQMLQGLDGDLYINRPFPVSKQCIGSCSVHTTATFVGSHLGEDAKNAIDPVYLSSQLMRKRAGEFLFSDTPAVRALGLVGEGARGAEPRESFAIIKERGMRPLSAAEKSNPSFYTQGAHGAEKQIHNDIVATMEAWRQKIPSGLSDAGKAKYLEKFQAAVDEKIENTLGKGYQKFMVDGKSFDPKSFAEKQLAGKTRVTEISTAYTMGDVPFEEVFTDIPGKARFEWRRVGLGKNYDAILEEVASSLKDHNFVALATHWDSRAVNEYTGVMALRPGEKINKNLVGHAMTVIGYERDQATKKITRLILQNSHGDTGREGIFFMNRAYFEEGFMNAYRFDSPAEAVSGKSVAANPLKARAPPTAFQDLPLSTRAEESVRDAVNAVQSPQRTVSNMLESWDAGSKLDAASAKLRAFPDSEGIVKESRSFVDGTEQDLRAQRYAIRSSEDPKVAALTAEKFETSISDRAAQFEERTDAFVKAHAGQPEALRAAGGVEEGVGRSLQALEERNAIYSGGYWKKDSPPLLTPPKIDRISSNDVRLTQSYVGAAQIQYGLDGMAKKAGNFEGLQQAARKLAKREVPAVTGPDLWGKTGLQTYITDGHHSGKQLDMLAHGRYEELPDSIKNIMSREQQKILARDPELKLSTNIEKTYLSLEEMTQDFAKKGSGLLPETVEKNPIFAPVLAKARKGEALSAEESQTLIKAYRHMAPDFARVKDDPVRSAIGKAFMDIQVSRDMRDYSQFLVARSEASQAIKDLRITSENAFSPKIQSALKDILLGDEKNVQYLRSIYREGVNKDGVAYRALNDAAIDKAVAKYLEDPAIDKTLVKPASIQESIEEKSRILLDKPYDHALGEGEHGIVSSKPLFCADKFDCTTYVETVTAEALARSPEEVEPLLRKIRYEDGKVSYLKRNHFAERDWIPNNEKAGFYTDITSKIAGDETKTVNATIDRGGWLRKLTADDVTRQIPLAQKEKIIGKIQKAGDAYKPTDVSLNYIPIDTLLKDQAVLDKIPSGSIFNMVRNDTTWIVKGEPKEIGTIISHQGFIIRKDGELYLRHASSAEQKIVDVPMKKYLKDMQQNPSIAGLNVLRVNPREEFEAAQASRMVKTERSTPLTEMTASYNDFIDKKHLLGGPQDKTQYSTWAKQMGDDSSLYRGMALFGGKKDLDAIATKGLEVNRTGQKMVFMASDPVEALKYTEVANQIHRMKDPENGLSDAWKGDEAYQVVVKVKKDTPGFSLPDKEEGYQVARIDIPPSAIEKIFVFDKNGPKEFPFKEYTVAEWKKELEAPSSVRGPPSVYENLPLSARVFGPLDDVTNTVLHPVRAVENAVETARADKALTAASEAMKPFHGGESLSQEAHSLTSGIRDDLQARRYAGQADSATAPVIWKEAKSSADERIAKFESREEEFLSANAGNTEAKAKSEGLHDAANRELDAAAERNSYLAWESPGKETKWRLEDSPQAIAKSELKDKAEASLAKVSESAPLSETKLAGLQEAHDVGLEDAAAGKLGKDKVNPPGLGNYNTSQLVDKAQILEKAGFTRDEWRALLKDGVVGHPVAERELIGLDEKLGHVINNKYVLDAKPKIQGKILLPSRAESEERLKAVAKLWTDVRPGEEFKNAVDDIKSSGKIASKYEPMIKAARDRMKMIRFLCNAVCEESVKIKKLDRLAATMGHLTDAAKYGSRSEVKAEAKNLRELLGKDNLQQIDSELAGMKAMRRPVLEEHVQSMIKSIRETLASNDISEKEFHAVRKNIGNLQTLELTNALTGRELASDKANYMGIHSVYEKIGDDHDAMVKKVLRGKKIPKIGFSSDEREQIEEVLRAFEPDKAELAPAAKAKSAPAPTSSAEEAARSSSFPATLTDETAPRHNPIFDERQALEDRAQKILDAHGDQKARSVLPPEKVTEFYQRSQKIDDLEAEIAKTIENRDLKSQAPARYVYELKSGKEIDQSPELAAVTKQKDLILRQNKGARIQYDPLGNGIQDLGGAQIDQVISLAHFDQSLSGKDLDFILQHEGMHMQKSMADMEGKPTAFDAYFNAHGDYKLGSEPYNTYLHKQEEATLRTQTKATLRYAEDAAVVRAVYGEEKIPKNILRRLQDEGIDIKNISADGKISGDFQALREYRGTTEASLREMTEVKEALQAKGKKAYTLNVTEDGMPIATFRKRSPEGKLLSERTLILAEERPHVKKGDWKPDPERAHKEITAQVDHLLYASQLTHDEALRITKEVDPASLAKLADRSPAAIASPARRLPLTTEESSALLKLTEQHAQEVQREMELLGNKNGRVVLLKKGEEAKGVKADSAPIEKASAPAAAPTLAVTNSEKFLDAAKKLDISPNKRSALLKDIPSKDLESTAIILHKVASNEFLTPHEAESIAKLLDDNNIRGIVNYHGTKPENLDSIAASGKIFSRNNDKRIYALPFHAPGYFGDAKVIFQGQAASLFGNYPKALALYHGNYYKVGGKYQVTRAGDLVLEEVKRDGDFLIVKKASLISSSSGFANSSSSVADSLLFSTRAMGSLHDAFATAIHPVRAFQNSLEASRAEAAFQNVGASLMHFKNGDALAAEAKSLAEGFGDDLRAQRYASHADPATASAIHKEAKESAEARLANFKEREAAFLADNAGNPNAEAAVKRLHDATNTKLDAAADKNSFLAWEKPGAETQWRLDPVTLAQKDTALRAPSSPMSHLWDSLRAKLPGGSNVYRSKAEGEAREVISQSNPAYAQLLAKRDQAVLERTAFIDENKTIYKALQVHGQAYINPYGHFSYEKLGSFENKLNKFDAVIRESAPAELELAQKVDETLTKLEREKLASLGPTASLEDKFKAVGYSSEDRRLALEAALPSQRSADDSFEFINGMKHRLESSIEPSIPAARDYPRFTREEMWNAIGAGAKGERNADDAFKFLWESQAKGQSLSQRAYVESGLAGKRSADDALSLVSDLSKKLESNKDITTFYGAGSEALSYAALATDRNAEDAYRTIVDLRRQWKAANIQVGEPERAFLYASQAVFSGERNVDEAIHFVKNFPSRVDSLEDLQALRDGLRSKQSAGKALDPAFTKFISESPGKHAGGHFETMEFSLDPKFESQLERSKIVATRGFGDREFLGKTYGVKIDLIDKPDGQWVRATVPDLAEANAVAKKYGFQYFVPKSNDGKSVEREVARMLAEDTPKLPYDPMHPFNLHDVAEHFVGYQGTPPEIWKLYQTRARFLTDLEKTSIAQKIQNHSNPTLRKFADQLFDEYAAKVDMGTGLRNHVFSAGNPGDRNALLRDSFARYDQFDLNLTEWSTQLTDSMEKRAARWVDSKSATSLSKDEFQLLKELTAKRADILDKVPLEAKTYRLSADANFVGRLDSGQLYRELQGRFSDSGPVAQHLVGDTSASRIPLTARTFGALDDAAATMLHPIHAVENAVETARAEKELTSAANAVKTFKGGESLAQEARSLTDGISDDLRARRYAGQTDPATAAVIWKDSKASADERIASFENRQKEFVEANAGNVKANASAEQLREAANRKLDAAADRNSFLAWERPGKETSWKLENRGNEAQPRALASLEHSTDRNYEALLREKPVQANLAKIDQAMGRESREQLFKALAQTDKRTQENFLKRLPAMANDPNKSEWKNLMEKMRSSSGSCER